MHEESAVEEAVAINHEPLSMEFLNLRPMATTTKDQRRSTHEIINQIFTRNLIRK
jgi:hypothetical protein